MFNFRSAIESIENNTDVDIVSTKPDVIDSNTVLYISSLLDLIETKDIDFFIGLNRLTDDLFKIQTFILNETKTKQDKITKINDFFCKLYFPILLHVFNEFKFNHEGFMGPEVLVIKRNYCINFWICQKQIRCPLNCDLKEKNQHN